MRIALTRRTDITNFDGVNRFIALLAEALAKLGHDPFIVSLCNGVKDEVKRWFKEAHGLDHEIPIYTLRQKCGSSWLGAAWDWWRKGSKLLREKSAEVAIVNGVVPIRFSPKIIVNHGIYTPGMPTGNLLYKQAARLLYRSYDVAVCVSNKLRNELKDAIGVDCKVLPLPMKLELYHPTKPEEREIIIIHIGTGPVKNPHISAESVRTLRKRGHDIKLIIIGTPINIPRDDAVKLKSMLPESQKLDLLCRAKALILPSSYEALPYVVLEAMACGTPPVVSTAVPEEVVINGYNGLRVHTLDPRDYAAALERLLTDQELWLKLSRNGREFVKQFNYIELQINTLI
jgi:glycosyltransferase involved in cell wall biosynthesis